MRKWMVLLVLVGVVGFSGAAGASLITIGTAEYNGASYNLIWEEDNNGNSLVWLDYSNPKADWDSQVAWAAGLEGELTLNLDSQYTITWSGTWRLPSAGDPPASGYHNTGSEMGHLFYESLGNLGYHDKDDNFQSDYGLKKTGPFESLVEKTYRTGTENTSNTGQAWQFNFQYGSAGKSTKSSEQYALAVRTATVSTVPVPGALLLLGSGMAGLGLFRKKLGRIRG